MKQCWICKGYFENLSKEHIIPRLFEGYVTTEEFSCAECNSNLGRYEQSLSQISIMMQNLDNANGEPTNVIPKGESPKRVRKWSYGDNPSVELSTDGTVQGEDWERPPGKVTSYDKIWRPGRVDMEVPGQDVHRSMVKAIMALACHMGFPQHLFDVPLGYLAGNDYDLTFMQPTSLGIPSRSMFAWVWIFAPPTTESMTIYGTVAYGPLSNIYRLSTDLRPAWPFCCELRAYSKRALCHDETDSYMNWRSTLLEEVSPLSTYRYIGSSGVYAAKESRESGLIVLETSPSRVSSGSTGTPGLVVPLHPSVLECRYDVRFENWVKSVQTEEKHKQFLANARDMDEWQKGFQTN